MSLKCYNKSCNQSFDEADNSELACQHHPGGPIFHEGYKGWSCCKKRVTDFTEFLEIPGCTKGRHSNVKPIEPEKPKANEADKLKPGESFSVSAAPPPKPLGLRPESNDELVDAKLLVLPGAKKAFEKAKEEQARKAAAAAAAAEANAADAEGAAVERTGGVPEDGTVCQRQACRAVYTGSQSAECFYHPGSPVFHEGNKFWSCCEKRTTDFDCFLDQKGCTEHADGHAWFKTEAQRETERLKQTQLRNDWFQTPTTVSVAIYVKNVNYEKSSFKINPTKLRATVVYDDGLEFEHNVDLRGVINPSESKVIIGVTKVEISMRKADNHNWESIAVPESS